MFFDTSSADLLVVDDVSLSSELLLAESVDVEDGEDVSLVEASLHLVDRVLIFVAARELAIAQFDLQLAAQSFFEVEVHDGILEET